jgi:hypothetical protein
MHVVTVLSMWELVTYVSKHLVRMAQEQACEGQTLPSVVFPISIKVQAPELTCTITPHRDPSFFARATFCQELSPNIEAEYRALTSQLPALEPPLPGSYATEAEWLVAMGAHFRTWFRWRDAHPEDWRDAYHRACDRLRELAEIRQQPCKAFTINVGREGRAQRLPPKFLRPLRRVETWRCKPERRAPLEYGLDRITAKMRRLRRQGQFEEATALEASRQRIAAQMESWPEEVKRQRQARWPWGRKALWIEPDQTPDDDVHFVLLLYLLQEQMGECTPEIAHFLQRYMRQFRYAASREERDLLQGKHTRYLLEGGGEGFAALLRTYAQPEHWKAQRRFIAKTLCRRWRTAARQEAEQSGEGCAVSPRSDGLYSVLDAVRILEREAYEGQWTPPRDWLDDRMHKGILPYVLNVRGWKCLDEDGLHCARQLVKDENDRGALVAYQMDELRQSRRAVNKFIQEHEARGESLEAIAEALLSQQRSRHP